MLEKSLILNSSQ